ncbi:MAG: hypothetical protein R3C45_21330 [Phycisphaerales bacterium]
MNPHDPKPNTAGPIALELQILRQPDNSTCGPTSLHAVYKYYGDIELKQVITQTRSSAALHDHARQPRPGARL